MSNDYFERLATWRDLVLTSSNPDKSKLRINNQMYWHFDVDLHMSSERLGKVELSLYLRDNTTGAIVYTWQDDGNFVWGDDFVFRHIGGNEADYEFGTHYVENLLKIQSERLAKIVKAVLS